MKKSLLIWSKWHNNSNRFFFACKFHHMKASWYFSLPSAVTAPAVGHQGTSVDWAELQYQSHKVWWCILADVFDYPIATLQGTIHISHQTGKRKSSSKVPLGGDMLVLRRVVNSTCKGPWNGSFVISELFSHIFWKFKHANRWCCILWNNGQDGSMSCLQEYLNGDYKL